MNSRERYIKAQKIQNAKDYADIKRRIKDGLYPKEFSMPLTVQFELTSECNLFCKHCYNQSSPYRKPKMSASDWYEVVKDIIHNGGVFQCIISGGEPLLIGKDLIGIMDLLNKDGTGFVLITNGYLVDDVWINALKQFQYFWVQVSIDHIIAEKHDEFRGKVGSWDKAVRAACMFSNSGLPLRIAHSMTADSVEYLPQFAEFCYQLGATSLICGEIILSGRAAQNRMLLLKQHDYDNFYGVINQVREEYQGKLNVITSANEILQMKFKTKTPNGSIIIRPDGNVRLDCTAPFVIGNVLKQPFSEIWRTNGIRAWTNEKVKAYLNDLDSFRYSVHHINYVDSDIQL